MCYHQPAFEVNPDHLDQNPEHLRFATANYAGGGGIVRILLTVTPLGDLIVHVATVDDYGNEIMTGAVHGALVSDYGDAVPDSVVHRAVMDDYGNVVDVDCVAVDPHEVIA